MAEKTNNFDLSGEKTESLCPRCLKVVEAVRVTRGNDVFLKKNCPQHGTFETIIWRGNPEFDTWRVDKIHSKPNQPFTNVERGCPYDCGPCGDHLLNPCCVLLEVTQRCDSKCPICFADSNSHPARDPSLEEIAGWYQRLLETKTSLNIQLSGGEPTLRDDLADIIRMGKAAGYSYFQLNTNGLRIADDLDYLKGLKEAGLSSVFLQFDGLKEETWLAIRGKSCLSKKIQAIQNCAGLDIGVVLVPVIIPGINDDEIGEILKFAIQRHPGVRGIHFQPVSYFGRFPTAPQDEDRITLPEIITKLEQQSQGMVKMGDFKPSQAEHARCTFSANFIVQEGGVLKPASQPQANQCYCQPVNAEGARVRAQSFVARSWSMPAGASLKPAPEQNSFDLWDEIVNASKRKSFAISAMAFQDAWTIELERLRECKIFVLSPDQRLIPFCAYNLTGIDGNSLYRGCI